MGECTPDCTLKRPIHYADDSGYFARSGVSNLPLDAQQSSVVSGGNGCTATVVHPDSRQTPTTQPNYWVDVIFTATAP
jgi:hypothetical protein